MFVQRASGMCLIFFTDNLEFCLLFFCVVPCFFIRRKIKQTPPREFFFFYSLGWKFIFYRRHVKKMVAPVSVVCHEKELQAPSIDRLLLISALRHFS